MHMKSSLVWRGIRDSTSKQDGDMPFFEELGQAKVIKIAEDAAEENKEKFAV